MDDACSEAPAVAERLLKLEEGFGRFDVVAVDPPWWMWGSATKDAAARKHYALMSEEAIRALPIRKLFRDRGACFCWATCPRLDLAIDTLRSWGLVYRGVAMIWVKTTRAGKIIHGQGVRPTSIKPTCELLLLGTTNKQGCPFPVLDASIGQVIEAARGAHSEKPAAFRDRIVRCYGDRPRLEMFARKASPGWSVWGAESDGSVSPRNADGLPVVIE